MAFDPTRFENHSDEDARHGSWALLSNLTDETGRSEQLVHLVEIASLRFAIPPGLAAELAPPLPLAALPHSPPGFRGLVNQRGDIVPVYTLYPFLSGATPPAIGYFLIAGVGENRVALEVERARAVLDHQPERRPPPSLFDAPALDAAVTAEITVDDEPVYELQVLEAVDALKQRRVETLAP